jgi:hypothetical protein
MPITATEGFSFSVDLTQEDYRCLFALLERRQQQRMAAKWLHFVAPAGAALVALMLGVMSHLMTPQNSVWEVGGLCGLAFLIGTQVMSDVFRAAHKRATLRSTADAARWRFASIRVDADGIGISDDRTVIEWRWPAVAEVSVEDGAVMFWVGTLYAMRIPGRVFATVAERDAVQAYAHSRMASG